MAFSFQIPTYCEAVLSARLYLSVKGTHSAYCVGAGFGRQEKNKQLGNSCWLLLQKLRFVEWIFQGREHALSPLVVVAGKVSMLTLG